MAVDGESALTVDAGGDNWSEVIHSWAGDARADSVAGILTLSVAAAPPPGLPQLLIKAGVRRLLIDGEKSLLTLWRERLPGPQFYWQGLDGTRIEVCLRGAELLQEDPTRPLPLWAGELPAVRPGQVPDPVRENSSQSQRLHTAIRNALFLNSVRQNSRRTAALDFSEAVDPGAAALESIRDSISDLAASVDTRGLKRPVIVISNVSHFANEAISVPLKDGEIPVTAIGPEGDAQQVQIVEIGESRTAVFIPKNVPLHGYAVWDLGATFIPAESEDEVSASRTHLENSALRVEFDASTGLMLRLFDKDSERELLDETFTVQRNGKRELKHAACGNRLFFATSPDLPVTTLERAEIIEAGPVRAAIRFTRRLPDGRSIIKQVIRLTSGSARLDFSTDIEWYGEDGALLSADFPVAINAYSAAQETPFGHVRRPTYQNSESDRSRFDRTLCKWVDISEGDYGVSMLSSALHLLSAEGGTLRFSIPLRRPSELQPGEPANIRFSYALLPHGGDIREGEVVENSFALSRPLLHSPIPANRPGTLPLETTFFEVDNASVFIQSIERLAGKGGIMVRLFEAYNTRGEVLLTTTLPVKRAFLCDLIDEEVVEIPFENGEALLPVMPFEIISVKFTL